MKLGVCLAGAALLALPASHVAFAQQEPAGPVADSIVVEGARRVPEGTVRQQIGLSAGAVIAFPDVQRAISNLFATGHYDDIQVEQRTVAGRTWLVFRVVERPVLLRWSVEGAEKMSRGNIRSQVLVAEGRPLNPAQLERSRAGIDSLYRAEGYYQSRIDTRLTHGPDSATVRLVFAVREGVRVPLAQIIVEGNEGLSDGEVAGAMKTSPEGFWWFKRGEYDEDKLQQDLYERLPSHYRKRGYLDFQLLGDTLAIDQSTGKGVLTVQVNEGQRYRVGTFEIVGNRRFSTEELETLYPFQIGSSGFLGLGGRRAERPVFDQSRWEDARQDVVTLYNNEGYIRADVRAEVTRRTTEEGDPLVDLRWLIQERNPFTIRRVNIIGNSVTHEPVIREALMTIPGDVFNQDRLINSYRNIASLGFFDEAMPPPDVDFVNNQEVDITFHVVERRTGNFNFGASVGQGTGVGGFLGVEEPNLFGRGKRGSIQWQFGRNNNNVQLSYTDPAIKGSRISGTLSVHNTRLRFTIADLGRITSRGVSLQLGFPFHDRFTRVFLQYAFEQENFTGTRTNEAFQSRFFCNNCLRSSVGVTLQRDTRLGGLFPISGSMHRAGLTLNGGFLGGTGDFRKLDLEGRWYAPLAQLGGSGFAGGGPTIVLGFQARSGFIFGDAGPFFRQLYTLGGTQFGIPLRGYDEFAITPQGFDPAARNRVASPDAFGEAFFKMTGEVGMRLSQMLYLSTFIDAGNNWSGVDEFNPTRLFRGIGVGVSLVSPLGPLGLDYAYGIDRVDLDGNPDPGWKLHFKLGNIF